MQPKNPRLLGQIALREGCLTPDQLDECLRIQSSSKPPLKLGVILLERGHLLTRELDGLLELQRLKVDPIPTSPRTPCYFSERG